MRGNGTDPADSGSNVMRTSLLVLSMAVASVAALAQTTHNAVVSRDWAGGKLTLKLDDGSAEIEWITPVAIRVSRSWGGNAPTLQKITHEAISPTLEDVGQTISMRTRYITVDVDRGDMALRVRSGDTAVSNSLLARTGDAVELRLGFAQNERVFGLMGGESGRLNRRGEKLIREHGFFFSSAGYGVFVRSPERCAFDMTDGVVRAAGAQSIDYLFYYGPTAKEILEQHATAMGSTEVKNASLDLLSPAQLPREATRLPGTPIDSWDALRGLVRRVNEWSLSAILYPALDLAVFDKAPPEIRQRAEDLSAMLPIVYRAAGEGGVDPHARYMWKPYLMTYLREAYDRGYPLIRPLPIQFSRDANSEKQSDVFMLGDELLLAPVVAPGTKRALELPRGNWTDLRTNQAYRGNQTIEVDAPAGQVPMFVRNGWIVPFEMQSKMELHYFPDLGGEFFLWEPEQGENSQFHAAPAGDFVRVEIETKVRRTYEWVLHHTKAPRLVEEESGAYQKANSREALRPGMWWHDASQNNLHLMLRVEAGADRIVNISF